MRGTGPRRRIGLALTGLLVLASTVAAEQPTDGRPIVRIGIVFDGSGDGAIAPARHTELAETIIGETTTLTRREFDVRFPASKRGHGSWSADGARRALDRLLEDPEIDVVLTLGAIATNEACRRDDLPKPVVAAFAIDIETQRLPAARDEQDRLISGKHNLNYLIQPGSTARDLQTMAGLGRFDRIHVLVDASLLQGIRDLRRQADERSVDLGIPLLLVPVGETARSALDALPPDAQGVYVTPLPRLDGREFDRLVAGLIQRRLPSMSLTGRSEVERGIMTALRPAADDARLARRIALNLQRILLGEDAAGLPAELEQQERLVLNMRTVRAIDFPIPLRTVIEAELVGMDGEPAPVLTLDEAVGEAVKTNLALRARQREVAAGLESVARARSAFRPQIETSASALRIDEDRAAGSFGTQAEMTFNGRLSVGQLIWSDPARANLAAAKDLQGALELDYEAARLEIAAEAATAFLDVLRAQTLVRVERENLGLTRENLELARRRVDIGSSGVAEVYRWESRLATAKSDVIAASNRVEAARLLLNRLMHRPLREAAGLVQPRLDDPTLITGVGRLGPYLESIQGIERFREFMVQEGLANAPEIQALDSSIAAQQRLVLAARRAFWLPSVQLNGAWDRAFSRSGAGSDPVAVLGAVQDRQTWSLGLSAILPLYAGGERSALLRQANEELARLRFERNNVAEAVELRIRTAMTRAGTSFPSITLAQEAAAASRKNLELVSDAYSRGAVAILDLLDAQNAALIADEAASNAVFDFLVDLVELQRAANSLGFFMSAEERKLFFGRVEAFFGAARKGVGS